MEVTDNNRFMKDERVGLYNTTIRDLIGKDNVRHFTLVTWLAKHER